MLYVATYIKQIIHNINCAILVRVVKGGNIHVSQVSGLVETLSLGFFSDTINDVNVKLCTIALYIELYLFVTLSVTLIFFKVTAVLNSFN